MEIVWLIIIFLVAPIIIGVSIGNRLNKKGAKEIYDMFSKQKDEFKEKLVVLGNPIGKTLKEIERIIGTHTYIDIKEKTRILKWENYFEIICTDDDKMKCIEVLKTLIDN